MDEANENIMISFYEYLVNDTENKFLNDMVKFLKESFAQFKNYEKSLNKHKDKGSSAANDGQ